MNFSRRFITYLPVVALVSVIALLIGLLNVHAQTSPTVVISQLYGGGGNAGATLRNDFIELFNAGSTSIDITGWSVQYTSSAGTTWTNRTNLTSVTLQPGQYYLVQEAAGTGGTTSLPTPDQTGTINMSATAGKVALVNTTTALTCTSGCATAAGVVDFVGFGGANDSETAPTAAPSNTTAVLRNANGCTDTNNNAADFTAGSPNPRNTASTLNPCTGDTTPTFQPPTNTPTASLTPTVVAGCSTIQEIQGAAQISPCNNLNVTGIQGIVTSIYYITSGTPPVTSARGFYMQAPSDGNDATSDGILVFTSSAPSVNLGDGVSVNGRISEFRPGSTGLTVTELASPVVAVLSSGNAIPAATVIGAGGRVAPTTVIEDDSSGNVETSNTFDPDNDGIDFYESLEGMRVQVNNSFVVGPTNQFFETWVLPDNGAGAGPRTVRGGIVIAPGGDFNPERVMIDDETLKGLGLSYSPMNVADTIPGAVVGIMSYDFGNFRVELTQPFASVSGGLAQEATTAGSDDQLTIATFNVENLNPGDPAAKFARLGSMVANNLRSPDVVTVEEVQDNTGPTDDGTVDANVTWGMLISAISSAGGPTYQYRQINPVNDQDGGQPGGNIRQGFLFNPARVSFVDRAGGDSTTANSVVCTSGQAQLQFSPGRLSPADSAWNASRKPIAGEFSFNGHSVIVIGNHFNSKGGDDPLYGHNQPPVLGSATQRTAQATIVHDFIANVLSCQTDANAVTLGDLNDFQFSTPLQTLKGTILDNLMDTLPANEQYSYDFDGNAQVLDQILVTHHLTDTASPQYDVVHVNSEFYNNALPDSVRTSDHDPSVARLSLPLPATATPTPTATNTPTDTPTNTPTFTPTATPTSTATNTPTSTPTFTPTPPAHFARLNLSAVCTPDPRSIRVWRVRNNNPFPVTFTWKVLGFSQSGTGVVPAASGGHAGETTFTSHPELLLDIMTLYANGDLQDVAISDPFRCPSAAPAPSFQPPTNTPTH